MARSRTSNHVNHAISLLIILQYIPRLIVIFPLNWRIIKNTGVVAKTAWTGAAYNLILYLLASHVYTYINNAFLYSNTTHTYIYMVRDNLLLLRRLHCRFWEQSGIWCPWVGSFRAGNRHASTKWASQSVKVVISIAWPLALTVMLGLLPQRCSGNVMPKLGTTILGCLPLLCMMKLQQLISLTNTSIVYGLDWRVSGQYYRVTAFWSLTSLDSFFGKNNLTFKKLQFNP